MVPDMIPDDFLNRMKGSMPEEEFEAFAKSLGSEPFKSLRINSLKEPSGGEGLYSALKDAFSLERVPWCENGYYYDPASLPGKHPLHEAGAYYIQEASAMAPVGWLDVREGMRVLDLCAAPGGKSSAIAECLKGSGVIVSNEIIKSRAKTLSQNMERMGIGNALILNENPERLSEVFEGFFDRILVDAPCSGEGMFRRLDTAGEEWSPENVEMCAVRQQGILKEASKMLCPGGRLIYSTCTFSEAENERVIEGFLKEEDDFYTINPESIRALPEGFLSAGDPPFGVRLMPHRIRGEGHFFAVLARKGERPGGQRFSAAGMPPPAGERERRLFLEFAEEYLPGFGTGEGRIISFGEQLYFMNGSMPGINGLKAVRPGLHLGTVKKDRFEPSHALALYVKPSFIKYNARVDNVEDALQYLKGASLSAGLLNGKKGWCIISFSGYSLGWGKSDGRTIKNHYPKGLRIL